MNVVTNQPHPRSENLASGKPRNSPLTWKDYGPLGRFTFWISLSYALLGLVGEVVAGFAAISTAITWPFIIAGGLGMMISFAVAMLEKRVRDLEELVQELKGREIPDED